LGGDEGDVAGGEVAVVGDVFDAGAGCGDDGEEMREGAGAVRDVCCNAAEAAVSGEAAVK